jgi:hypothetical protein
MKARRPRGGLFGVQMTNIVVYYPVEPLYQGINDVSNRHTDHRGSMKIVDVKLRISIVLLDLQAPRRIWKSSEARLPRKVFNRSCNHSA